MALPINTVTQRKHLARAYSNGELVDATMLASQDAQNADLCEAVNQCKSRLEAISTSAGSLNYALVSVNSFTATSGQTAFTVTAYDNTAGASFVLAFANGLALAQSAITQTSTTVVTLSAQTLGTAVKIVIFAAGNGTSQLASTSNGQGAALIGIEDAGAYLTATTVEGALQELAGNLASSAYIGGVIGLSGYLAKSGGTMTGAIAMGSSKITGLAAGTAGSNDAARMADITSAALQSTLSGYLAATYLPLTGGTMSGALAMGGNKVTGLAAGSANGDAIRYEQYVAIPAGNITSGTIAAARLPTFVADAGGSAGVQGAVPASASGDAAAFKFLCADATWRVPTTAAGSGYIILRDEKANTTDGGGSTASTWTKRDLTTEVVDTGNHCSLSSSVFTLAAGTYRIRASAPTHKSTGAQLRLYNNTAAATTLLGTCVWESNANDYAVTRSELVGRFTIAVPSAFEIQHWTNNTVNTFGFGRAVSSGTTEVYTVVEIERE